jgi:hypothetical protein
VAAYLVRYAAYGLFDYFVEGFLVYLHARAFLPL